MTGLLDRGAAGAPSRMTFMDHLRELRRRIFYSVIAVFVLTIVTMSFAPEIFEWLRGPLDGLSHQKLIVLSPLELYITYLKLAVLAALFISAPWVLLQLWLFVAPGLYAHEKRWVLPFVFFGTVFFFGGGAFAFYVVLPFGFQYLVAFLPETIEAQYSVAVYFSLVINLMLAFGVVFELPLIMWILSAAGIVEPKTYSKMRRYWIVLAFVIAAVLTPPDPFTQSLMAIPLLVFFEAGVLGAKILYRKRAASAGRAPAAQP